MWFSDYLDTSRCETRKVDTRKTQKVTYGGVDYIDITDFFSEGFYNGDDYIPSKKHVEEGGNIHDRR